jgi:hypothetical protein
MKDAPRLTLPSIQGHQGPMSRRKPSGVLICVTPGKAFSVVAALFGVAACAKDIVILESTVQPAAYPFEAGVPRLPHANPDAGRTSTPAKNIACVPSSCDGGVWSQATCSCESPTSACAEGKTQYEASYTGSHGVTMSLASMPRIPMVADNQTWTMSIDLPSGQPVPDGTTISVTCKMIHVGFSHGCPSYIEVTRSGDTFTASPVNFNMQGSWLLTVKVGDLDTISFGICAQ